MPKVILGYWKIRGLGQYLRLLLAYTGVQFEEAQHADFEKWFAQEKQSLGLDFPNLPYLIDGDFKLTESSAIAKYIIAKSGRNELLGKGTVDKATVLEILGVFDDLMKDIRELFRDKDWETKKAAPLEKAKPKLEYLKQFVGHNNFALGYLTLVDFVLAESLHYFETIYPNEVHNYRFWIKIRTSFNSLPEVAAYYKRPDAIHGPFLPPMAAVQVKAPKVKLAYWGVRGLGQIARLLLAFTGVEFQNFVYTEGEKWHKEDKIHLGLDFPNLPYLMDGPIGITESSAINEYIIHRGGFTELLGKNPQDAALINMLVAIFGEAQGAVRGLFYNPDHANAKVGVLEKIAPKLDLLQKFIGEKHFAIGYLTYADFYISEFSNYILKVFPEESAKWPFMKNIRDNFNQLPQIVGYYARADAFKAPFYPGSAFIKVEEA